MIYSLHILIMKSQVNSIILKSYSKMYRRALICAILLLVMSGNGNGKKKKGKYVVNFSSPVKVCEDDVSKSFTEMMDLKAVLINETTAELDGGMRTFVTMNGLMKINILVEKILSTGTKEVITTHILEDLCEKLLNRKNDKIYGYYLNSLTLPDCPIPPGEYRVNNLLVNTDQLPLNSAFEGEYLLTFTYLQYEAIQKGLLSPTKDKFIGCVTFQCSVEKV